MGLVHCNRLRVFCANKSHGFGGDGVAPHIGDHAIDLTVGSGSVHHIIIGRMVDSAALPFRSANRIRYRVVRLHRFIENMLIGLTQQATTT